eukprot:RCo010077
MEIDAEGLALALEKLRQCPPEALQRCVPTLRKLLTNINEQPYNPKFRSVRLGNPAVAAALGEVPAAHDLLRAVGFVQEDQVLVLPTTARLARVSEALQGLSSVEFQQPPYGASAAAAPSPSDGHTPRTQGQSADTGPASGSSLATSSSSSSVSPSASTTPAEALLAQREVYEQIRAEKRRQLLLDGGDPGALRALPPEVLWQTLDPLLRILSNIMTQPQEPKFRLLRASNPTLRALVFSQPGAVAVLTQAGFVLEQGTDPGGDVLRLPEGADLTPAQRCVEELHQLRDETQAVLQA